MNTKKTWLVLLLSVVTFGTSAAQTQQTSAKKDVKPATKSLVIYDESKNVGRHFWISAGWMPDGSGIAVDENCSVNPFEGESCIKISADLRNNAWVGVYWLPRGKDPWTSKGTNVWEALNTGKGGNVKLTFFAKGKNGGEFVEFKCGGKSNSPNEDSMTFAKSTRIIKLENSWKKYSIDLKEEDLSHIAGAFVWVTEKTANSENDIVTFYLDNIQFETY